MKSFFLSFILAALSVSGALAVGPTVWSVNSRADVLKGDARGLSVDQNGTLTLAPKLSEVFKTEQQYIWSSVTDTAGNTFIGTGGDGKVFKVTSNGASSLFADLAEMNVTSLAFGRSGELFAGTSPDGKVYRIDGSGRAEVFFSPQQKYIWSLAVFSDGSLAVATGDGGRIYKVRSANASPESSLLFDTSETNIISLAIDKAGNLYTGTDSNGLLMRFGPDGRPFGLLDSPLREIHEIAVDTDGSVYALAVGESASAPAKAETSATPAAKSESVTKPTAASEPAAKSRYDLTNARSAVYRILPDGAVDLLWASTTVTGFSIYAHQTGNGVLLGTSDKGRIYNIANDGRDAMVLQTDANQISTIRADGRGLLATSSNAGTLYRFGPDTVAEGTYESSVLDANGSAAWGRIWWRSTGAVTIQTRSGNTENADETWSAWSSPLTSPAGGQISSPKARYLQWRAVLKSTQTTAALSEVNLAFVPRNIAPEVLSLTVLPTNVGLLANPPVQVDPNIALSGLAPAIFGIPSAAVPPRRAYLRGATSLQWTAEDRNGDDLVYDVHYKQVGDANFKTLREGLTDTFLAIDGQALADGRYIFKIVARDTPSNPAQLALFGEKQTEPVDIDNTAPTVRAVGNPQTGDTTRLTFEASDASYITRAEYSVNGGEWKQVYGDDGIADGPNERFTLEIPLPRPGEYAITLRVFDVNGNSGNALAVVRR